MQMHNTLRIALGVAGIVVAAQAGAQVTLYDNDHLRGRAFTTDRSVENMRSTGFDNRAASAIVDGGTWEACENPRFGGRCVVLRPGRYESLADVNLNYQISSIRPFEGTVYGDRAYNDRYAASNGRDAERIYAADIVSVRAVMGPAEQRCWVEPEQVVTDDRRGGPNIGGAIAGAVIGGVLGHQIGSGRGNDLATAGGAVGGAAIGANVGRDRSGGTVTTTRDVQRCENVGSEQPQYWDVTYRFRGQEHHAQLTQPPTGNTLAVNAYGDPRM